MATPTFDFKIATPFAKNGIRQTIPETSGTTEISYDQGWTAAYQQPPAEGGRFIEMSKMNEALYRVFAAVQEVQNILTEGKFTVSEAVRAQAATVADGLSSILGIPQGGTGAATSAGARANLGLGNVNNTADMDKPISNATQTALNNKQDKLTFPLTVPQGGTGATTKDGVRGILELAPVPHFVADAATPAQVSAAMAVGDFRTIRCPATTALYLPSGGAYVCVSIFERRDTTHVGELAYYTGFVRNGGGQFKPASVGSTKDTDYIVGYIWRIA